MRMSVWAILVTPALLPTLAGEPAREAAAGHLSGRQQAAAPSPTVDHHMHIWSLDIGRLTTDPLLPETDVPADLKQLLADREELVKSKDPKVMARLYTEDAMVLDAMAPTWLKGEKAVEFIAHSMGSFPMVPMSYRVDGSAGYIAGTYKSRRGEQGAHLANFLLVLAKGGDGKWRISAETFTPNPPPMPAAATPETLIADMDDAGIRRAVVLSVAYMFGSAHRPAPSDELARVMAENDWAAQQAARYPDRLIPFFSFNPLKDYALDELDRCAKNPAFKGIKLHFGNSGVDLKKAEHVEKVRRVFEAANAKRLPIVAHLWTISKDYGKAHSEVFLRRLVPAAPDIPIQIAHLAASGPGYHSDDALEVFAKAGESGDPAMKNLYFDVASIVTKDSSAASMELVAKRLRQLGMRRILFASDRAGSRNEPPAAAWQAFRRLPLTPDELKSVAANVAPYVK